MAPFTDEPRSATATAVGEVKLIPFSPELLLQRMQTNPQFTVNLLQTLINRLRSTTSTLRTVIDRMQTYDAESMAFIFPENQDPETSEMIKYLKEQIDFKDKEIERQQIIITQLSKNG